MAKRIFDLLLGVLGLALLAPVLAILAVAIRIDSPGPVFFRQERVGRGGRIFRIHKFRTMVVDAERKGLQLTTGADRRITRVGAIVRRYKLDEFPQLIDVVLGDMSLVGPRPEVPRYVARYPEDVRAIVLSVRPGITDEASIAYRDENDLLGASEDPEQTYVQVVMPAKLEYAVRYVRTHSLPGDVRIILRTLAAVFGGRG